MKATETTKTPPEGYARRADVAAFLGVKEKTLANWALLGKGPQCRKLAKGRSSPVRYAWADVLAWIESKPSAGEGVAL
jgi:predicted DNA-binding transcriptional regulator AlpA